MQQGHYLKNEEEKETNNLPPHHHYHPNATCTDAIFMSYRLPLPYFGGSVVRCEVTYENIEHDTMVFRNCVLMRAARTVIDTYITSSSSSSYRSHGDDDSIMQVFRAARISTSIIRYNGNMERESKTIVSDTIFLVKAVEINNPKSVLKAQEQVRRNMAAMKGEERHHRNLLRMKAHFMDKQSGKFCIVMPFPGDSLRTVMRIVFPGGFPEDLILSALRPVLNALGFLHTQSIFHTDINAGHVYLGQRFHMIYDADLHYEFNDEINLGFAATVYDDDDDDDDDDDEREKYLPVASMSNWAAAPEVYNGNQPYSDKADIWLVGITALELAYGGLRVANRNALEAMINEIHDKKKLPFPGLGKINNNYQEKQHEEANNNMFKTAFKYYLQNLLQSFSSSSTSNGDELLVPLISSSSPYDEESLMLPNCSNDNDDEEDYYYCSAFSETFTDMVMKCLAWDPEKRPGVDELMSHSFFRHNWSRLDGYYLYEQVMKQWPSSSS